MSRARATLLVLLALGGSVAWSETPAPTVVVRAFSSLGTEDLGTLPQSLGDSMNNQLRQAGFVIVDGSYAHPARFESRGLLVREKGNLFLQVEFLDAALQSIVASEVISVHEGLTALNPIYNAMAAVIQRVKGYWGQVSLVPPPVAPLQDPVVFSSPDEGAQVFWQNHQLVGRILKGKLTAPYYPFPSNQRLTVSVEKEGYRVQVVEVPLSPGQSEYLLPKLVKLRVDELFPFVSSGKLLGLGVEYRRYVLPDWSFVGAEAYPFVQWHPGASGAQPVFHLDLAGSVGTWIYFPADSLFRLGVEASLGLSQTMTQASAYAPSQWFLDATVSPFGVLMEWNLWGVTLESRVQVPYSLGLPSGLLGQRWLLVDGTFPLLALGTVLRW